MGNPKKAKGSQWVRDAVKLLAILCPESYWKVIPGSGALGTILEEPLLGGDIVGRIVPLGKTIRAEAKVGYGGAKQFALKREWLTKIREEAERTHSIPMLFGKFSGARGSSKHFVVLDFEAFGEVMERLVEISNAEITLLMELDKLKNDK